MSWMLRVAKLLQLLLQRMIWRTASMQNCGHCRPTAPSCRWVLPLGVYMKVDSPQICCSAQVT